MVNPFEAAPVGLRSDRSQALGRAWTWLAGSGSWLDCSQRLAVAAEARHAWGCGLCQQRQAALSPYAITGHHDDLGHLPPAWVEVVHRVVTDAGRLSERWFREALAAGMEEDEFVEIICVVVLTVTVDAFALGIGMPTLALPVATPGTPPRSRPPTAKPGPGWVATIAPQDAGPDFADFYANDSHFYIRRSLTLVPEETRRLWDLLNSLYLEDPEFTNSMGSTGPFLGRKWSFWRLGRRPFWGAIIEPRAMPCGSG